jgi:hypothetical protein
MQDAAGKFLTTFSEVPEVARWLLEDKLTGAPGMQRLPLGLALAGRQETMQRLLVHGLVGLPFQSGCATSSPTSVPIPHSASMSSVRTEENVTVGAEVYTQGDKQKQYFGGDLCGAGVLPIQVMIANEGQRRILVRPSEIFPVLPDGSQICEIGPYAAASKMESIGGVVASGIAFGLVGVLVGIKCGGQGPGGRPGRLQAQGVPGSTACRRRVGPRLFVLCASPGNQSIR